MTAPLLVLMVIGGGPVNAEIVGSVYADGRDGWTLLDQKLLNRQLFLQVEDDSQTFRHGRDLDPLVIAADGGVGAQVAPPNSELARFHGFFLLETYVGLRLLDGVEVNLNLNLLNPSASDGYRYSSQANAGVAVHLHEAIGEVDDEPLVLDFVALDLDLVTLGQGLLIERLPLEGHAASLSYGPIELRELFAGRTFWFDDDLQTISLGLWDGLVEAMFAAWITEDVPPGVEVEETTTNGEAVSLPHVVAYYAGVSADWEVRENLRFGVEYSGRIRPSVLRNAAMVRVDFLDRLPSKPPVQLHLGYQFRYYQRGFGPRDTLVTPTALPNLPLREDAYVTNSFEVLSLSRFYTQISHTVMLESLLFLSERATLFVNLEYWARWLIDPRPDSQRVVYVSRFGRAPGWGDEIYYRAGVQLQPWAKLPHRFKAYVGNKFVASAFDVTIPDARRFVQDPLVVLEMEVYL